MDFSLCFFILSRSNISFMETINFQCAIPREHAAKVGKVFLVPLHFVMVCVVVCLLLEKKWTERTDKDYFISHFEELLKLIIFLLRTCDSFFGGWEGETLLESSRFRLVAELWALREKLKTFHSYFWRTCDFISKLLKSHSTVVH